jgi:hypothetical protein
MYKKGCWYLVAPEPFGDGVRDLEECSGRVSEESAARTYCLSGRTWTLLALPVRVEREKGERKAGWPGFPHSGKERARTEGESGKGRGSLAMGGNGPGRKGVSGMAGVPSQWEGKGQEEKEKAGRPGFPRNGRERARKKRRKREGRASLAMGGNGPERKGESEMGEVPSQWEVTGQEEKGESGMAGVPSQWEETGQRRRARDVG